MAILFDSAGDAFKVSDGDVQWLMSHVWHPHTAGYLVASIRGELVLMHRLITGAVCGLDVDHANGDKRDNRRFNLRVCTRAENVFNRGPNKNNRSGLKGIYQNKRGKWVVELRAGGVKHYVGCYDDVATAQSAYAAKAKELHGEFVRLR